MEYENSFPIILGDILIWNFSLTKWLTTCLSFLTKLEKIIWCISSISTWLACAFIFLFPKAAIDHFLAISSDPPPVSFLSLSSLAILLLTHSQITILSSTTFLQLPMCRSSLFIYCGGEIYKLQQALLSSYYQQHTDAFIYVVDSGNMEKIDESKENLWKLCSNTLTAPRPLLILANKQDQPNVMTTAEISERFELARLHNRNWCKLLCKVYTISF